MRSWSDLNPTALAGWSLGLVLVATWWWLTPSGQMPDGVREERKNLLTLADTLWQQVPQRDFSTLTLSQAIANRWVPGAMIRAQGHPVRTRWGTAVALEPYTVRAPGDGFSVIYDKVPTPACRALAREVGAQLHGLQISGKDVMGVDGPEWSLVDQFCAVDQGARMRFSFQNDFIPGTALRKAQD